MTVREQVAEAAALQAAQQQSGLVARKDVLGYLQDPATKERLRKVVPPGLDGDYLWSVFMQEIQRTPKLLQCTRESFAASLMASAQLGLQPGPLGQMYLIPYGNKCTLIIGYRGLIQLARRSGEIKSLKARAVYEADFFEFEEGLEDRLVHRPSLSVPDRGALTHVYGVAHFRPDGETFRVMPRREVDAIRARSRASGDGPWVTDFEAMACKTVLRKMANSGELPLTTQVAQAIAEDEQREYAIEQPIADIPLEQTPGSLVEGINADGSFDAVNSVEDSGDSEE